MKLKNKLILAPMAGITDQVFRQICIEQGADVVYSEMINITGINHLNKKTMFMLKNDYNQKYLAIQLFGSNVEEFVIAAKYVEKHIKPYIIDINMGCPVPKVVNTGAGSALMKKPELIVKIINALIKEIKTPLTIKIRSGWDDNSINCLEIAKIAAKSNIAAIFIHPRTKKQGYTGNAD
jgi:tRNA-dihydrouridine synthase B